MDVAFNAELQLAVIYMHVRFMFAGSRRTTHTRAEQATHSSHFLQRLCVLFHYLLMAFFIAPLIVITLDLCACLPGFSAPVY